MERVSFETCKAIQTEREALYGKFAKTASVYAKCMDAIIIVKTKSYFSSRQKPNKLVMEMLKGLIALKAGRILSTPDNEVDSIRDSYNDLVNYLSFANELKYYNLVLNPAFFNPNLEKVHELSLEQICHIINTEGLFAKGIEWVFTIGEDGKVGEQNENV